jgi:hypothetical protein
MQIESISIVTEYDQENDYSYLEQDMFQDAEGLKVKAQFDAGDRYMVGVYAKATVMVNGTYQIVRTPGLWGIDSESGADYFEEVGNEELDNLRGTLIELGATREQLDEAYFVLGEGLAL